MWPAPGRNTGAGAGAGAVVGVVVGAGAVAGAAGAAEAWERFLTCDVGVDTADSGDGEEKTADFGRPLLGPGDVLAKGLLRGCAMIAALGRSNW